MNSALRSAHHAALDRVLDKAQKLNNVQPNFQVKRISLFTITNAKTLERTVAAKATITVQLDGFAEENEFVTPSTLG